MPATAAAFERTFTPTFSHTGEIFVCVHCYICVHTHVCIYVLANTWPIPILIQSNSYMEIPREVSRHDPLLLPFIVKLKVLLVFPYRRRPPCVDTFDLRPLDFIIRILARSS